MQRFFVLKYDFSIIKQIEIAARGENRLCLLSLRQNKNPSFPGHVPGKDTLRAANAATKEGVNGGENRGIHERDPCRLTWAISGDFRLVVLGILLYSCVLRTKTRSKIAPWQVQRSFDRRICARAMKRPQTIRVAIGKGFEDASVQIRRAKPTCIPSMYALRASCEVRLLSYRPSSLSSRLNFVPRSPRKSSTKRKQALPVVSSSK